MNPRCLFLVAAFAAIVSPVSMVAAEAAEGAAPARTFTLFMGSDLEVNRERGLLPIRDFSKGSFMVRDQDALVRVPITPSVQFKISRTLKLSESALQVEGLAMERAFTFARDPGRQAIANANSTTASAQQAEQAATYVGQASAARDVNARAAETDLGARGARDSGAFQRQEAIVMRNAARAEVAADSALTNASASIESENFDAITISFKVAAAQAISDAYVVVIAQYRAPGDKPGHARNWVYAEELDSVNDQPRRVYIKQGGFPPGFELLNQEVHFYRHGREIASNVSGKAVQLSLEEAHEYLVIDYLTANKAATLDPSVAIGVGNKEFFPRYTDAQLQREIFVKVDKAGLPQGAFRDERCSQAAGDDFLDALVSRVRFKPALKEGKAVEGVAKLKIGGLAI